jgi:hypothetical protein
MELYLFSPFGLSWPVLRRTLFTFYILKNPHVANDICRKFRQKIETYLFHGTEAFLKS